jgi:hypothetical protein
LRRGLGFRHCRLVQARPGNLDNEPGSSKTTKRQKKPPGEPEGDAWRIN